MKIFRVLFLLVISLFLVNCSDEKDEFRFDAQSLRQTTWEGTNLVTDGNQVVRTIGVIIQFFTIDTGQYVLKEDGSTEVYNFKYSIDGKIIDIEDGPLWGKRTLIKFNKNTMVLEAFSSYKSTITLSKTQ